MSTSKSSEYFETLKCNSPELSNLPNGWTFIVAASADQRIYFLNTTTKQTTYTHPRLGPLPRPWILKVASDTKRGLRAAYYHREKLITTSKDPRNETEALLNFSKPASEDLWVAASARRNIGLDYSAMQRQPIGKKNIRDQFEIVHVIDDGSGGIGAMNGGVFVVRMKGIANKLQVEKRFKSELGEMARSEIRMAYELKHPALTTYSSAFITSDPTPDMSLYVEFCDRGSLADMIKAYARRGPPSVHHRIPEAFVWHAFIGLCDGFAYLQGGGSIYTSAGLRPRSGWIPILHRDMKPDNVLVKSRSTVGSGKYPYCVISDFGLACEDRPDDDPLVDVSQKCKGKLGTKLYWAPELCHAPYPRRDPFKPQFPDWQFKLFPDQGHSLKSDAWALGASIHNFCNANPDNTFLHVEFSTCPKDVNEDDWIEGTASRVKDLRIPNCYTPELEKAIRLATTWDPQARPDAITLVKILIFLAERAGYKNHDRPEPLPEWSSRVHEYFGKAEQVARK